LTASNKASVGSVMGAPWAGATRSARGTAPGSASGGACGGLIAASPGFAMDGGGPIRDEGLFPEGMLIPFGPACAQTGRIPVPSSNAAASDRRTSSLEFVGDRRMRGTVWHIGFHDRNPGRVWHPSLGLRGRGRLSRPGVRRRPIMIASGVRRVTQGLTRPTRVRPASTLSGCGGSCGRVPPCPRYRQRRPSAPRATSPVHPP